MEPIQTAWWITSHADRRTDRWLSLLPSWVGLNWEGNKFSNAPKCCSTQPDRILLQEFRRGLFSTFPSNGKWGRGNSSQRNQPPQGRAILFTLSSCAATSVNPCRIPAKRQAHMTLVLPYDTIALVYVVRVSFTMSPCSSSVGMLVLRPKLLS